MATETELLKDGDIIYKPLTEARSEEGAVLLTDAFVGAEPISNCLKQPYEAELASSQSVCRAATKDGVSVVAIDNTNNKLVGITTASLATVAEFFKEDVAGSVLAPPEALPYYNSVMAFIGELDKFLQEDEDFTKNPDAMVCSSAKLGVDKTYRGRGIATKLIQLRTQLAREKGCKFIVAQASAPGSQKLYSNLGFEEAGEIKFCDFEYQGERVFGAITACLSSKLFVLKL